MLYDVHMYVTVRVKIKNIEADDMRKAIKKAEDETDLHDLLLRTVLDGGRIETDYAEEVTAYLVDVVGDEDYSESATFNADEDLTLFNRTARPEAKSSMEQSS